MKLCHKREFKILFKKSTEKSMAFKGNDKQKASQQIVEQRICRIYHEKNGTNLLSPCHCSRTSKLVDYNCLCKWIKTSGSEICDVCRTKYSGIRYRIIEKTFRQFLQEKVLSKKVFFGAIIAIILILISTIFRFIVYYNNIKFLGIVYDKEQNSMKKILFFYSILANYMIETFWSIIALIVLILVIAGIPLEF